LAIIFSESLRDDVKVVFGEAKSSGDIDEDEKSKLLSLRMSDLNMLAVTGGRE
jgi:hypothetical protein